MGCFNRWQIGGCGCDCGSCYPCALPAADLHASLSITLSGTVYNGSGTLPYTFNFANNHCQWDANPAAPGPINLGTFGGNPLTASVYIDCGSTCTGYTVYIWEGGNEAYAYCYEHPTNCEGCPAGGYAMTLGAYTCSPLNIPFSSTVLSMSLVITP